MSEHDEFGSAGAEDGNADEADVVAHGFKEVAVTGLSAAAMIVGAGDALAANAPEHASAASKQAVHKIDAANKSAAVSKQAVSKDAVYKGASVQKGATFKGNAVVKFAVSKEAVDPSSRRGRDAS